MRQRTEGDGVADGDGDAGAQRLGKLRRLIAARGIAVRPYETLLLLLGGEGVPFDEIVRRTALPRRAVEEALAALDDVVEQADGGLRLRPDVDGTALAETTGGGAVVGMPVNAKSSPDAGAGSWAGVACGDADVALPADVLARVAELVHGAPRPKHELDHVAATPETVVRRAVLLQRTFVLTGRRVLLVGDRDLTSLALALIDPTVEIAVADIDDDVLAYIDRQPEGRGRVRCWFADARLGLPPRLRSWADLAITDPPYTPDGVGLFVRRGLEGLADLGQGRVVLAYGYGDQPGLGLKVQDALRDLRLVYEAVLPAFNRYVGAQAIGSASHLYVLRATAGTKRVLGRRAMPKRQNVYTHGRHSLEGGVDVLDPTEVTVLEQAAAGPERLRVVAAVGGSWPENVAPRPAGLDACLFPPSPERSPCSTTEGAVMADLRHDGGSLLLRLLLASRAPRLAALVPNQHPDLTSAPAQAALQAAVGDKYVLRYRRSVPARKLAIVEAALVTRREGPGPDPSGVDGDQVPATARRYVLDRPHGKLANVSREALIAATGPHRAEPLTRNAGRNVVAEALPDLDLDACLVDLPRHTIDELLATIGTLAAHLA